MNINKFFELAKNEGITASELNISKGKSLSISIFKGEIEGFTIAESEHLSARGIYNGKMGYCNTEKLDKTLFPHIIKTIKDSSSLIEKKEEPIIFKGSEKYKKGQYYNKELNNISVEYKINLLKDLEKYCASLDSRITDIEISYEDQESEHILANSYGLKLKEKSNSYYISLSVVVKDGEEVKLDYDLSFGNDLTTFDYKEFAEKVVNKAINLLHGKNIKSGKYNCVFKNNVVSNLLNALLSNLSADNIQKHTSKFEGKLNELVLSNKLTVTETPLAKNIFFSYFDDEGVAMNNKKIIDKGVLKTYFYNLETAKKDGVESTGNARRTGSKIDISFGNLVVKPGKLTEEGLIQKINNGLYITKLNGLHAGLDSISGNFSLEGEGYAIVDGKIDHALGLFVLSGNIFDLFNNIIGIANNSQLLIDSNTIPSIAFKKLGYSAE